jgi:hypothetical protein
MNLPASPLQLQQRARHYKFDVIRMRRYGQYRSVHDDSP